MEPKDYPFMFFTSVNRRVDPYIMKDDELLDCVNWWTEKKVGAKKVRPALRPFLNRVDTDPVRGLFYAKFPNGNKRLLRLSGKKIYAVDPTSASNWSTAKLTASGNNGWVRPDFTILTGLVHIVDRMSASNFKYIEGNASDSYSERTTESDTDPVVPYPAATIVTYHRRVYVGDSYDGTNEYASMISWSSIDYLDKGTDPSSPWTTQATLVDITYASSRQIDRDYKGNILKITNINDRLNIYKEEGIYRYNETQVFDIFGLSPYKGSIATMEETKEDYFFTNEGFFKTDGKTSEPIGDGWYPIIKEILANGITTSKINSWAGNFLYFCYLGDVTYGGKTVTNACFVYNAFYQEMTLWSLGFDITAIGSYIDASGDKVIVMGDVNGYTYFLDYESDIDSNGTTEVPIFAFFDTKYYFFDNPKTYKNIVDFMGFAILGSETKMEFSIDFLNDYKDFLELSGVKSDNQFDPNIIGQFFALSFRFSWNGQGVRPEIYGIIPKIQDLGERMTGETKD